MATWWALIVPLLVFLPVSRAKELTESNWERTAGGHPIFIKFFAPGCGHCRTMAPDWARLMEDYADSDFGVYEVNCEGSGKSLCAQFRLEGTPALKHGNASIGKVNRQDYKDFPLEPAKPDGGRNYATMRKFAEKVFGPLCTPTNLEPCKPEEQRFLNEFSAKSKEELNAEISSLTTRFHDQDKKWRKRKANFDEQNADFQKVLKELKKEKALFVKAAEKFKAKAKSTSREKAKQEEKEKKMQAKFDAQENKRQDLLTEREAVENQREEIDAQRKQSGLRYMKLVVNSWNDVKGTEEL